MHDEWHKFASTYLSNKKLQAPVKLWNYMSTYRYKEKEIHNLILYLQVTIRQIRNYKPWSNYETICQHLDAKREKFLIWYSTSWLTCNVKSLSSNWTSLVRKSAPMVALYWLLNFRFTYWFIKDVFPTPLSPRIMTLRSMRLREAILANSENP